MAPYPGWDVFSHEVEENLRTFRDMAGFRKLLHLGVRFINRIDIPMDSGNIDMGRFLAIGPMFPPALANHNVENYFVNAQIAYSKVARVTIQTGLIPDALIGHISVLLDIDVVRLSDLPQKFDAIPEILLDLRAIKNDVFEICISDAARALFEVSPL
jgi:uncharacterized protein (TIGR04255 family)